MSSVPLSDSFSWTDNNDTCLRILVNDTLESDGRFVLYQIASQALLLGHQNTASPARSPGTTRSGHIYWLSGAPYSVSQIRVALQKIMAGSSGAHQSAHLVPSNQITIRSLPLELATAAAKNITQQDDELQEKKIDWKYQFLQRLYGDVKDWLESRAALEDDNAETNSSLCCWIILDDVSSLALLLGERRVFSWIWGIHDMLCKYNRNFHRHEQPTEMASAATSCTSSCGLILRASADADYELLKGGQQAAPTSQPEGTHFPLISQVQEHYDYVGAGGQRSVISTSIPWERMLVELADTVIDVLPLASGHSREVHGRLIIKSFHPWRETTIYNYCLTDSAVMITRLLQQH